MNLLKRLFNTKSNKAPISIKETNIKVINEPPDSSASLTSENEVKVKKEKLVKVLAYGFEHWGFFPTNNKEIISGYDVEYFNLSEAPPFQNYDIVIIPQGAFESLRRESNVMHSWIEHHWDRNELMKRTREYLLSLKAKTSICFLVRDIVDQYSDNRTTEHISNTDLCKRILNFYEVKRRNVSASLVTCKQEEFKNYLDSYGSAQTSFETPDKTGLKLRTIAQASSNIVGFEIGAKTYFLPFHETKRGQDVLKEIVAKIADAILSYRRRRLLEIPKWLEAIQFSPEAKIQESIALKEKEVAELQAGLELYKRYKSILVAKGDILKDTVKEILQREFGLLIKDFGEKIEDLMELDKDSNPSIPLEIKGVNDNVKAEHVNQVTNHKERRNLALDKQGVLVINNMADSGDSLSGKEKAVVHPEIAKHAYRNKVLIIRTIDLFQCLMRAEKEPELKDKFVEAFHTEAGWFHITENSWQIEIGS